MTFEELGQQLDPLCALYGKELSEGAMDAWFRVFRFERPEPFRRAVDRHVRTSKFLPKPAELLQHIKEEEAADKASSLSGSASADAVCPRCEGKGLIPFFKVVGEAAYHLVARCSCHSGASKGHRVALYDDLFPGQPHQTLTQYVETAYAKEAQWVRKHQGAPRKPGNLEFGGVRGATRSRGTPREK